MTTPPERRVPLGTRRRFRPPAGRAALPWLLLGLLPLVLGAPLRAQAVTTEGVGSAEVEAGNIVADAVRSAGKADVGIVPAAAFKPGASAPRPTSGDQAVGLVHPADDAVVVLVLRGAQVLAALERAVSFAPNDSNLFLQVSGVRFSYDPGRPVGKRVASAAVNGAPISPARTYRVATTEPLATGGLGYYRIWDKAKPEPTGKTLAAALRESAAGRGGTLSAPPEGRITRGGR